MLDPNQYPHGGRSWDLVPHVTVPQTFSHLSVLLVSGRESNKSVDFFGRTKAEALTMAWYRVFTKLKVSALRANYTVAVLSYSDKTVAQIPPTSLVDVDTLFRGDYGRYGTAVYLDQGLGQAKAFADRFLSASGTISRRSVTVGVLTDEMEPQSFRDVYSVARQLKCDPRVKIRAGYLGLPDTFDPAFFRTLRCIASDQDAGFSHLYTGQSLDQFILGTVTGPIS